MIFYFCAMDKAIKRAAGLMMSGVGVLVVLFGLSACSSLGTADQALTRKIPLHEQEITKVAGSAEHAIVVVYRQGEQGSDKIGNPSYPPINLYVNGDYHASLRPRSQIELTLCAGSQRLYPLLDSTSTALGDKNGKGTYYDLKPGSRQYLRVVSEPNGVAKLEVVKAEEAQLELAAPSRQVYTISRFQAKQVCAQKS